MTNNLHRETDDAGYTLVEMIIVVFLLASLSVMVIPFFHSMSNAKKSDRILLAHWLTRQKLSAALSPLHRRLCIGDKDIIVQEWQKKRWYSLNQHFTASDGNYFEIKKTTDIARVCTDIGDSSALFSTDIWLNEQGKHYNREEFNARR